MSLIGGGDSLAYIIEIWSSCYRVNLLVHTINDFNEELLLLRHTTIDWILILMVYV